MLTETALAYGLFIPDRFLEGSAELVWATVEGGIVAYDIVTHPFWSGARSGTWNAVAQLT